MATMYSSMKWIPKGKLNNYPMMPDYKDEFNRQFEHEAMDEDKDEIGSKYHFEDYDDDVNERAKYALTVQNDGMDPQNMSEEDSEIEENLIADTDSILIAGCANTYETDYRIEFHLVEDAPDAEPYVHHDLMMPNIPLCIEYIDMTAHPLNGTRNILAVSCLESQMELWDIDSLDDRAPLAVFDEKQGIVTNKTREMGEEIEKADTSVISISWNPNQQNIIATGSSDHCVRFWDISNMTLARTLQHHHGDVQVCSWNPVNSSVLATGGFANGNVKPTMFILDARQQQTVGSYYCDCDMNEFLWNVDGNLFLSTFEDGRVELRDMRKLENRLWNLQAHQKECTSISIYGNDCFVTGGADKTMRIWKIQNNVPVNVRSFNTKGDVLSLSFCKDRPGYLAVGGEFGLKFMRPFK